MDMANSDLTRHGKNCSIFMFILQKVSAKPYLELMLKIDECIGSSSHSLTTYESGLTQVC
jgi:hypothetical protein